MAIDESSCVVPEVDIDLRLNVEVDHADNAVRFQEKGQRVDDGVVVRLYYYKFLLIKALGCTYDHRQAVGHGDEIGAGMA
jgi:hypothetical protein